MGLLSARSGHLVLNPVLFAPYGDRCQYSFPTLFNMRFNKIAVALMCFISASALGSEDEVGTSVAITMDDSLSFSGKAPSLNLDTLGIWRVTPVASALAFSQTNPSSGAGDISNAQLLIQKSEGDLQFFIQTGLYSVPVLGKPIVRTLSNTVDTYGYIPNASVSYVLDQNWSVTAGKLASMGGYESTMTFQNVNIQRGLLWDQTSSVSYGTVVNYAKDDLSLAVTWNDGYYSNKMNWLGASGAYQLNDKQSVGLSWVGSTSGNSQSNANTPLLQNNSQIMNALYKYSGERWYLAPYLQYTVVPVNGAIGITSEYQTYGAALLGNYRFPGTAITGLGSAKMSLPFRLEYIQEKGGTLNNVNSMLYGPDSSAVSLTITPTIQFDGYFARAEGSVVRITNPEPGLGFGANDAKRSQFRMMLEVGLLY